MVSYPIQTVGVILFPIWC